MMTGTERILIIGLGLLGGSYAQALSAQGFCVRAITPEQDDLDYARERGWIESGSTEPCEDDVAWAELAIFAVYPNILVSWVGQYGHWFRPGTVLTDVTGVKSAIVYRVQELLPPGVEFIGAHPMAGRETSGVRNSTAEIFRGANYLVTPTKQNSPGAIALCRDLGKRLGFAHICELSPEEHDSAVAYVSQLTHCIAISLMTCNRDPELCNYTGDSFRDLTRIARVNDEMWSELFFLNRDALVSQIDSFAGELHRIRTYLSDGDSQKLREMMRLSTSRREQFDRKNSNTL